MKEIKLGDESLKISTSVGSIKLIPFEDVVGYCIKIVGNDSAKTMTIEELSSRIIVAIHEKKDDDDGILQQHSDGHWQDVRLI